MARSNRRKQVYAARVSKRQVRRSARRSQLKFGVKTLQMKEVVSQRGRTHPMEAEVPGMTKEQLPQDVLMRSTAIRKFKYYFKEKKLRIWFVEGGAYDYFDVPESVVLDLGRAQSKGHYFYYNIRTTYKFIKV